MPTSAPGAPRFTVVVPILNKRALLVPALASVFRAAARRRDVEVVLVDNGSTDGALEVARSYADRAVVHEMRGTISALRNWGARRGTGAYLAFVDSDVVVPDDYFDRLDAEFAAGRARAVGCEYHLPDAPTLVERVWHQLTVREDDAFRHYINAGNFAMTRALFERVGGFPEDFETGEDTELCARIRALGEPIYQSQTLAAQHLGNAKTLGAFYRRLRWHARGISDGRRIILHKPTVMMLANVALLAAAVVLVAAPLPVPLAARVVAAAALALCVPLVTYAFRLAQVRRSVNLPVALLLIEIFYAARAAAFVEAAVRLRRARRAARGEGRLAASTHDG